MDREQVIRELTVLMEAFKEERGAYPVCIEEAIRLLKEAHNEEDHQSEEV